MVRHDDALDAGVHRPSGVLGVEHTLQHQRTVPVLAHPGEVVPRHARVELAVDPLLEAPGVPPARHRLLEVAEGVRLPAERHVAHPLRVRREVDGLPQLLPERHLADHAVAVVAVAGAHHREVHGEHQHGAPGRLRPAHQLLGVGAVAHHVELVPERGVGPGGDLLDRADRHRRLAERHARRLGRLRCLHLGPLGEHPAQAHRREDHRHRQLLAQHRDAEVQLRHVPHHPLPERDRREVVHVGPHRRLVVGAAVDVVEQLAGETATGELPVVGDGARGEPEWTVGTQRHGADRNGADGPQTGEPSTTMKGSDSYRSTI